MTQERMINKIRKLLALANDAAATEGERDNAMRMAYGLLSKHNLDMVDVQGTADQEPREEQSSEFCGFPYVRSLCGTIADLFFCKYFYAQRPGSKTAHHYFVGKQSNAITAHEMSAYVTSSLLKELRQRFGSTSTSETRAFAIGVVSRLRERVRELKAQAAAEAKGVSGERALALVSLYDQEAAANAAFIKSSGHDLTAPANTGSKGVHGGYADSYHAGREYGGKIGLNQQLGAARSNVKRLT